MKRVDLRDDSGATLIMVLVLVTVMAVGLSALLTLTDTNVRATVALREQAAAVYDADGAMQTAINGIRESAYTGASGQHCFGGSDTMSVPAPSGTGSAAVTCTADPAKVLVHCPSLATCNRPGSAVLTLGRTAGEDGLHIEQPNAGSTFRVHGTIFSNSTIAVDNGTLSTNARVYARGTCTGTIVSTPAPSCDYGSTANPLGDDPGYAPATSVVPPWRALPACTTPDSVVAFEPGYYDDAAGLSAMMAGNSACRRSTWWFKPGVYYFDFHNSGSNANPVLPNAPNVWTVDDGHLVAGTPVNAAGAVVATPSVPAAIPGACQNPIKNAGAVGVQFIFGGDSQFAVKSGQVEICGTYSVTRPPVAVYGLKSGSDTVTTANGAQPTSVTPGAFADATTARLASLEGTYAAGSFASWTTNANTNNQSGQVTTDGYGQTTIPAGSVLVSAKLRVGHRYRPQAGGRPSEALSAIVTPAGAPAFTVPVPAYAGTLPAGQMDTVDITTQLAGTVRTSGFSGAQIAFRAVVGQRGTEDLDGMQLDLVYVAPALRAGSGCVTAGPYTGLGNASRCALVSTVNNNANEFYVQGTTYAPNGVLDVTLNNAAEQVFRFGVVARSVWVKLTGSFSYNGPVIEVPDDAPGFAFSVHLAVTLCPTTATCAPAGTPALTARVAYIDADPVSPTPGRRQVAVLSWSSPA
ncbi:hypothetical protein GCM10023148_15920 [Actinokineospora soli]